jgi:arsenate reductase-like glutaredoxin family protein
VRGFLAREQVAHQFVDVRRAPIDRAGALALVRRHRQAVATRGGKLVRLDVKSASDDEICKLFLGREGTLRAPTLSNGHVILGGFDEATLRELCGAK